MTTKHVQLNVIELFAGVGGFRIGLENANSKLFNTVFGNQFEPSRKSQVAFDIYNTHFNNTNSLNSNENISLVENEVFSQLKPNLVVGGFPCQDYSVARSLKNNSGLEGKKGVLFWDIARILEETDPEYVLLENVDRLLKSPANQRGRDFAVMLGTLRDLDYNVEWRMINAAEYGMAQRRRRVFIFAYKNNTRFRLDQDKFTDHEKVYQSGFFAPKFTVSPVPYKQRENDGVLPKDILDISDNFSFDFHTAGTMIDGNLFTAHVDPIVQDPRTIRNILVDENTVEESAYLTDDQIKRFEYMRGAKKIDRVSKTGHAYTFSEGAMSQIDDLDKPSRTMLTSEASNNRSSHIIEVNNRKRFLTPIECERLNGFPDNWTYGMSNRMRYFTMGNALVVDLITIMGKRIEEIVS